MANLTSIFARILNKSSISSFDLLLAVRYQSTILETLTKAVCCLEFSTFFALSLASNNSGLT